MDPHPRIWSYKQNLSKNLCYTHFRALLLVENFEQPIGKLKNERSIILRWKYLYNVHAMFRTSTKLVPNKYQTCSILDFSFHCHPSSATRPCSRPFRLMTSFDDRRKKWSSRPNRFRNRKWDRFQSFRIPRRDIFQDTQFPKKVYKKNCFHCLHLLTLSKSVQRYFHKSNSTRDPSKNTYLEGLNGAGHDRSYLLN